MQETTAEFGQRLRDEVDRCPDAPPGMHGRQRWLARKLRDETGFTASHNTINKWFRGLSRPREDAIRKLAQVLRTDETWLSMGRRSAPRAEATIETDRKANGATMALAGLFEMEGYRVAFPGRADSPSASLYVSAHGRQVGVTVAASPEPARGDMTFFVTEPVGRNKVVVVIPRPGCGTAAFDLLDVTEVTRQNLGGYSLVEVSRRKDGRFKLPGQRHLVSPLEGVDELVPAPAES